MVQFGIAETINDLQEILALQKLNLKSQISDQAKKDQGFLTVNHSLDELLLMKQNTPQIVARYEGEIVAFALAMLPGLGKLISDLQPMFDIIEGITLKSEKLSNQRYYVMGQICVGEKFRGQGIFDGLYQTHKEIYSPNFDLCITEISTSNARSQRAHERVGFQTIHNHRDHVDDWNVVAWEF